MSDHMRLHALADNCLDPEESRLAEAELRENPASKAEFDAIRNLKGLLHLKAEKHTCAKTWQRCVSRLDELQKREKVEGFVGRYAWGLCSIFLVVIAGAAIMNRTYGHDLRAGDVAKIVGGVGPFSTSTAPPAEDMSRWLDRAQVHLDFGDLTPAAFIQSNFEGRNFAQFDLFDESGRVRLIIAQGFENLIGAEPILDSSEYSSSMVNRMNCVSWNQDGFLLVLLAPRSLDETLKLAQSIRLTR
jgi:hypothetical protein